KATRARLEMQAPTCCGVRNLIVILGKYDEIRGCEIESRRAPALPLPRKPLTLVQWAVFGRGDEFLRNAAITAVVRLVPPCGRDPRRMVKVVVPHRIQTVAAGLVRSNKPSVLRLVFGDEHSAALAGCRANDGVDLRDDVRRRFVEDLLRRVKPK